MEYQRLLYTQNNGLYFYKGTNKIVQCFFADTDYKRLEKLVFCVKQNLKNVHT